MPSKVQPVAWTECQASFPKALADRLAVAQISELESKNPCLDSGANGGVQSPGPLTVGALVVRSEVLPNTELHGLILSYVIRMSSPWITCPTEFLAVAATMNGGAEIKTILKAAWTEAQRRKHRQPSTPPEFETVTFAPQSNPVC